MPISKPLVEFLKKDFAEREDREEWYLDDGSGVNVYGSEEKMARPFTLVNKNLGIQGVKPLHGIRASVISYLLQEGHEITWVQKLARHANLETTRGYLDSKVLPVQDMVDNLSSILQLD